MTKNKLIFIVAFICIGSVLISQNEYDNITDASSVEVYKTIDDIDLRLWFYSPDKVKATTPQPAIIFFFGGGWSGGSPKQFIEHSKYLAARGMVAIVADYRVSNRHGVKAEKCVSDAKSAIRYLRKNAVRLGINPEKIVSAGGSAGGHLGASVALLPGLDDKLDDIIISSIPNASVLFNPVLVTAAIPNVFDLKDRFSSTLHEKIGISLEAFSPYHNIKFGVGPMLIFHGTDDKTVPYITAKVFYDKMRKTGNVCTLVAYEGEGHGFFNYGKKANGPYIDTVKRMDDFLVMLGYIDAVPKLKVY